MIPVCSALGKTRLVKTFSPLLKKISTIELSTKMFAVAACPASRVHSRLVPKSVAYCSPALEWSRITFPFAVSTVSDKPFPSWSAKRTSSV